MCDKYKKIFSAKNDLVKKLIGLREKKIRDINNEFVVEGKKFIDEISCYVKMKKLILAERCFDLYFKDKKFICDDIFILENKLFDKVSEVKNSQGIMAVFEKKNLSLDDLLKKISLKKYLLVALEKINDPGNLGNIIRSCVAFGVDGLIISRGSVDLYNAKVLRATAGNIFKIDICDDCDLNLSLDKLKNDGAKIFATDLMAEKNIYDVDFKFKCVIIFGNEANGISKEILCKSDEKIKIRMKKNIESLNISVAAGILLNKIFMDRSDFFGL